MTRGKKRNESVLSKEKKGIKRAKRKKKGIKSSTRKKIIKNSK